MTRLFPSSNNDLITKWVKKDKVLPIGQYLVIFRWPTESLPILSAQQIQLLAEDFEKLLHLILRHCFKPLYDRPPFRRGLKPFPGFQLIKAVQIFRGYI